MHRPVPCFDSCTHLANLVEIAVEALSLVGASPLSSGAALAVVAVPAVTGCGQGNGQPLGSAQLHPHAVGQRGSYPASVA